MVNFYSPFVTCTNISTTSDVADQIDYIRSVCGDNCVGVGADYDGATDLPIGLENVSRYPYLIAELVRRNYTPEQITKVMGGNIRRVLQEVENVANSLKSEMPLETVIYPSNTALERVCRTSD
jgi:membrane dipeptidase